MNAVSSVDKSRDKQGRNYTKLSELNAGSRVDLDTGFDCMSGQKTVYRDGRGLYLLCKYGRHYLDGQVNDEGCLVGVYKVESSK